MFLNFGGVYCCLIFIMNILVCLSSVPDTTSKINFSTDKIELDSTGVQFVINPNDEFGLTRAVQLKEDIQASITVIGVGDISIEPILRKALAIGADSAIRVDAIPTDALFVSEQIANVAQGRNFDCIITGKESIDYNGGSVPAMISTRLDVPYVNNCTLMEFVEGKARCTREINGQKETLLVEMPLVICGEKGLVEEKDLKIPNMRGIMQARQKSIDIVEPIEAPVRVTLKKYEAPPEKEAVKLISPDKVDDLISILDKKSKIF